MAEIPEKCWVNPSSSCHRCHGVSLERLDSIDVCDPASLAAATMTRSPTSTTRARMESTSSRLRRSLRSAAVLTALAGGIVTMYMSPHIIKSPMYDSMQTGEAYIQELLRGHPDRIHDTLGVNKHVFRALIRELQEYAGFAPTKHVSQEEQLAIFLRLARTGLGQREARERFQRSPETVSLYVHIVLIIVIICIEHPKVCSTVYSTCLSRPASTNDTSSYPGEMRSRRRSRKIPASIRSSSLSVGRLTVPTLMPLFRRTLLHAIEIGKVASAKMSLLLAPSTCALPTFFLDGKGALPMDGYIKTHGQLTSLCTLELVISPMRGFRTVTLCLCPTEESGTT